MTRTDLSRNGRYLAILQPVEKDDPNTYRRYDKSRNMVSVYDTNTCELQWTSEVNGCHFLAINDHGNFVFVITHRKSFMAYECQLKDGSKVVLQHELPEIRTTQHALCFLNDNYLIVGNTGGKLYKVNINMLQGNHIYQTEKPLIISY